DIAARHALVAKDAIVEQRKAGAVMLSQKWGIRLASKRQACFGEPDVRGQRSEGNAGIDRTVAVEHGLAKAVEGEVAAALPSHSLTDAALFTVDHLAQARRAMGQGMVAHFDADPAPPHLVGDGCCGARAKKGIEDEITG